MQPTFDQRAKQTRNLERWAQVYREEPELFRQFEKAEDPDGLAAHALAEVAALPGKRVLEIGCGTGWLTRHVSNLAAQYTVVEPSRQMLAEAGDLGPAHVLQATGQALPFADNTFDRIVMSWVLLDLRPQIRRQVVRECERVLKLPCRGASEEQDVPGIWLIENAASGEFQELRNLVDAHGFGEVAPLIEQLGFRQVQTVATQMCFEDEQQAGRVLGGILGKQAAARFAEQPKASLGLHLSLLFRPAPLA